MAYEQPNRVAASTNRRLRADPPQRYRVNYPKYLARGGLIDLSDDIEGFVSGGVNEGDMARFHFFCLAFDQIVKEGIYGDLAELGVYRGNTATLLTRFARRLGSTAYLLDTYEGFSGKDLKGIDAAAKPTSFSDTSLDAVRALVGEDNACFIKGFFPDSAAQLPDQGSYCLVHLDCDLYAPMISALEYFYARLVPGGYLIVHDYSSLHWNGAEKAVDEFFADKPECAIPLPDGGGSVAIRKIRPDRRGDTWLDRSRSSLVSVDWTNASDGRLLNLHLLGCGWSGPEPWGVWGVGDLHELHLPILSHSCSEAEIEFEVQAALTESRPEQVVDVSIEGRTLATWSFTLGKNRGIRRLSVPTGLIQSEVSLPRNLTIEFRPRSVVTVSEINVNSIDDRALGLGLRRLRLLPNDRKP
jgi:hypothetical protein